MKSSVFFLCLLCLQAIASEKILIITHAYNRPDFIEWQYKTFNKFLNDEFEYVVFNDASNATLCTQISQICEKYGIKCIRIPQKIHTLNQPGARHQDCIHYSLDNFVFHHDGIVAMVDSDIFLVKAFSVAKYMQGHHIAALPQTRAQDVLYLWPGVVFMDMRTLPNKQTMDWHGGYVNGSATDTGGQMHYYLKRNPELKIKFIKHIGLPLPKQMMCVDCQKSMNSICTHHEDILIANGYDVSAIYKLDECLIRFLRKNHEVPIEFLLDNCFIHCAGSSWYFEGSTLKITLIHEFINDLLQGETFGI